MIKYYVKIGGIYCDHCRESIVKAVQDIPGVRSVSISGNIARIFADAYAEQPIIDTVCSIGYTAKEDWVCRGFNRWRAIQLAAVLGELAGLVLVWQLLCRLFGFDVFNIIPVIDSGLSLLAVFSAGLLTSLHCVGMCGAINLAASSSGKNAVLYNAGRVGCYTAVGFLVGLLGKTFSPDSTIQGYFTVCVAVLMLLMGLSMSGLFTLPQPACCQSVWRRSRNSFVLGVLNGFIPCGPLSAMQLYALSTASPWKGGTSMLLFGLGTVPLMLGFGALKSLFEKKKALVQHIMALLVVLLALSMLLRGFSILGVNLNADTRLEGYQIAEIREDFQYVKVTADYGNYGDIAVKVGIPVVFVIEVPEGYLTGCNNEILCKDPAFSQKLSVGENLIRFTPDKPGSYTYSCWMYMIKNQILVYE